MTTEFSNCGLFSRLPRPESLIYHGELTPHFQRYKMLAGGVESEILAATIIRQEEALLWEGSRDLLDRAVKDAARRSRGIYSFELLYFNALNELATFNYNELAQVLVNSSLTLRPGDDLLIRYSSVFGIMRKLVDEVWGKICFTTSIKVLPDDPVGLYKLMGQALNKVAGITIPVTILVNDLSAVPLYDPHSPEQQSALKKLDDRMAKHSAASSRECWIEGKRILPVNGHRWGDGS